MCWLITVLHGLLLRFKKLCNARKALQSYAFFLKWANVVESVDCVNVVKRIA